jgi:hypothetical protein
MKTKLISIVALLIFAVMGCAAIIAKAPTYKEAKGLTFYGESVPLLLPSDIPDFTLQGPIQGGHLSADIAYLLFLASDSDTQYILIVMTNCPKVLALMVVDGDGTRNWIYNSKGEPIQTGEEEMKAFFKIEHKCPPKSEDV